MNIEMLQPFGVASQGKGIDDLSNDDIDALKTVLADSGFIVFRKQSVTEQGFVDFLARLGSLTFTIGETPVNGQPDLNVVSSIGRTLPPKSVFHTDTSYVQEPPAYTALRAVVIPEPDGGAFYFSNQYLAYETLPASVKQELSEARVLHVVSGLTLDEGVESQCWHPLFKRHPVSGRTALFLSTPARCQAIAGVEAGKARRILKLLYRHSIRQHRIYAHPWAAGDILLWDNRCTMHRAELVQTVGDRLLHRGLVMGAAN